MARLLHALKIADARRKSPRVEPGIARTGGAGPRSSPFGLSPPSDISPALSEESALLQSRKPANDTAHGWRNNLGGDQPFEAAALAEQYWTLIDEFIKRLPPFARKVLCFTALGPGEGVSTTVFQLAGFLAKDDNCSVLAVDGNLRMPALHHHAHVNPAQGLSDVIAGTTLWPAAVMPCLVPNLHILAAGASARGRHVEYDSLAIRDLLAEVRERYSIVLIDAGSLWQPLAAELSRQADGTCLVVRSTRIARKPALAAVRRLRRLGARIAGCTFIGAQNESAPEAA